MAGRPHRSLALPVALGASSVALTIALLVGWTLIVVEIRSLTEEEIGGIWLLVMGIVSYGLIMAVVMLLVAYVVREVREGRRQGTFIDSVTHELKSPLSSLKLALETLERPELSSEQREGLRIMMLDDLDRLNAFIDDVLETSRLGHGRRSLNLETLDLASVAAHCAEQIARRYGVDPAGLVLQIPEGLKVYTDATVLDMLLKNILDNAVKYSEPPISVLLTAEEVAETIYLVVSDKGIGIPKSYQSRVGQRFFRVPHEAVRSRHGTGLGLFVVTELVRTLGGRLTVHSEGEGLGTQVRIRFPKGSEEPTP